MTPRHVGQHGPARLANDPIAAPISAYHNKFPTFSLRVYIYSFSTPNPNSQFPPSSPPLILANRRPASIPPTCRSRCQPAFPRFRARRHDDTHKPCHLASPLPVAGTAKAHPSLLLHLPLPVAGADGLPGCSSACLSSRGGWRGWRSPLPDSFFVLLSTRLSFPGDRRSQH